MSKYEAMLLRDQSLALSSKLSCNEKDVQGYEEVMHTTAFSLRIIADALSKMLNKKGVKI